MLVSAALAGCAGAQVEEGDPLDAAPPFVTGPTDGGTFVFPDLAFPTSLADAPPRPKFDEPNRDIPPAQWNCGATCFRDPSAGMLPATDPFGGAPDTTAARKPTVLYPLPGAMFPINLPEVTVQWTRAGMDQTLFRIRLAAPGGQAWDFVSACKPADAPMDAMNLMPTECFYTVPTWAWLAIANTQRGKDLNIEVAAITAPGGPIASSAAVPIAFSPGIVRGGLYYWSTALQGTYRAVFGGKKAAPFITPMSNTNRFSCGGCHAVSRDGRVIAFSAEQAGYLTIASTEDPTKKLVDPPNPPVTNGHVAALNSDGTRALVSFGPPGNMANGQLTVWDTTTGKQIGALNPAVLGTAERKVFFPEFSPDGTEIVATLAGRDERPWSVKDGIIAVIPFNDGQFGKAEVIVPREPNLIHFYPSWSPDGKWIVFASGPSNHNSYDSPQSRLRLVARGGGMIHELTRATFAIGKTSTWPKFAPFMQANGNLMFITFNSKMDYGFLLPNGRFQQDQARPQLWLSAIDLRKLEMGDPSYPPVWLPFQDTRQRNHLGYWTEQVVCSAAQGADSGCAEGETCENGQCYFNPVD